MLKKSLAQLRNAETAGKHDNHAVPGGQSPVHFSVHWPQGLELIIQAAADIDHPDAIGEPPIAYAYYYGNLESCALLLEHGCSLEMHVQAINRPQSILSAGFTRYRRRAEDHKVIDAEARLLARQIIAALRDRRRALRSKALSTLSPSHPVLLELCNDDVLDASYSAVVEALETAQVQMSRELRSAGYEVSVFFEVQDRWEAEQLYIAGFRDIDVLGKCGMTPLQRLMLECTSHSYQKIDLMAWFIEKGADHERHDGQGRTLLHFSAPTNLLMNLEVEKASFGEMLLGKWGSKMLSRDDCECSCSDGGCTPISIFVTSHPEISFQDLKEHAFRWTEIMQPSASERTSLWQAFVQAEKHKRLGLTHTCNCYKFVCAARGSISTEDAIEIADEESGLLDQLNSFMIKYNTSCLEASWTDMDETSCLRSLDDLLEPYWDPEP